MRSSRLTPFSSKPCKSSAGRFWPNLISLLHDAAKPPLKLPRTLLRGGFTLQNFVEPIGHLERHVPVVRRNRPRPGVLNKHVLGQFDDRVRLLQLRVVVECLYGRLPLAR